MSDGGLVVQDCLRICQNILNDSETCQRLFFSMGNWYLKLVDFINPLILENLTISNDTDDGGGSTTVVPWFEQKNHYACSVLAQQILSRCLNALSSGGPDCQRFQQMLCDYSHELISSSGYWLATRGPVECAMTSLLCLDAISNNNKATAQALFDAVLNVPSSPVKGIDVPLHAIYVELQYCWPSHHKRRLKSNVSGHSSGMVHITLAALLAETYIFKPNFWHPEIIGASAAVAADVPMMCLATFEDFLRSDSMVGGIVVQHILAPPPPPPAEDNPEGSSGTPQPIGLLIMNTLLVHLGSVTDHITNQQTHGFGNNSHVSKMAVASRAAHMFTLLLMHGKTIARELTSAISTSRTCLENSSSSQPILSYLMNQLGVLCRSGGALVNNFDSVALVSSLLQLLSVATMECATSANQVKEFVFVTSSALNVMDFLPP